MHSFILVGLLYQPQSHGGANVFAHSRDRSLVEPAPEETSHVDDKEDCTNRTELNSPPDERASTRSPAAGFATRTQPRVSRRVRSHAASDLRHVPAVM